MRKYHIIIKKITLLKIKIKIKVSRYWTVLLRQSSRVKNVNYVEMYQLGYPIRKKQKTILLNINHATNLLILFLIHSFFWKSVFLLSLPHVVTLAMAIYYRIRATSGLVTGPTKGLKSHTQSFNFLLYLVQFSFSS